MSKELREMFSGLIVVADRIGEDGWWLISKSDVNIISSFLEKMAIERNEEVSSDTEIGRVIHTLNSGLNSTNAVPSDFEAIALLKYFDQFSGEFRQELTRGDERWGTEYLTRNRKGQSSRIMLRTTEYFLDFVENKNPMPWLSVVGNAYIAWLRNRHPEMSENWEERDN